MLKSNYRKLCPVSLPYAGRQHYMHAFDLAAPVMREGFEDYLEPVIALCAAAGATHGIAYLTVDEKIVPAGMSQRRPKPHVDGRFVEGKKHRYVENAIGDWSSGGGWLHYCNRVPFKRMAVIVAASAVGCRAWRGLFEAEPDDGGDLSHVPFTGGELLDAGFGYLLWPDCVHESLVFTEPTQRTFLRIALPVEYAPPASGANEGG